jgi:hypothetical protein
MNDKLYWVALVSLFLVGFVLGQFGPQPEITERDASELQVSPS